MQYCSALKRHSTWFTSILYVEASHWVILKVSLFFAHSVKNCHEIDPVLFLSLQLFSIKQKAFFTNWSNDKSNQQQIKSKFFIGFLDKFYSFE